MPQAWRPSGGRSARRTAGSGRHRCADRASSVSAPSSAIFCCSAAGVEMDAELARRCGEAQGYPQRSYATFGLALAALENSHWSALAAIGPLRRWRLMEVDESVGLVAGRLRIDERILHYLAGVELSRHALAAVASTSGRARSHGGRVIGRFAEPVLEALRENSTRTLVVLSGDDPSGQTDVAAQVAAQLGLQLQRVRAEDLSAKHRRAGRLCRAMAARTGSAWRRVAGGMPGSGDAEIRRIPGRANRQHGIRRRP